MVINALNSGAQGLHGRLRGLELADLANMIGGQRNLRDAIDGTIDFTSDDGKEYKLGEETATLLVRPRGWHLPERHLAGRRRAGRRRARRLRPVTWPRRAQRLIDTGSGPYFYLPKMESHLEARLWNDAFVLAAGPARDPAAARSRRRS